MQQTITLSHEDRQGFIKNSILVSIAFSSMYLSRIADVLGAPDFINFLHFVTVPGVCLYALATTKTKDRQQISVIWGLLVGMSVFLAVNLISALVNQAGVINVLLNFLLLGEPFLMLLAIVSLSVTKNSIIQWQNWLACLACLNLVFVFIQKYALGVSNPDLLYGIFFSVAGATVSSIVSITFALYYFVSAPKTPLWIRIALLAATIWQILISDTKLVLGSLLFGFILLPFTKASYRAILYILLGGAAIYSFIWAMANVPIFKAYSIWIPADFLSPDGEFFRAKFTAFTYIPKFYSSIWNWFFGLGPGHTIGRLGGWMMEKYADLLDPLGATHPYLNLTSDVSRLSFAQTRKAGGTALYLPTFNWAGIWGDLGIVGLASYLLVWAIVFVNFCRTDLSRWLVLMLVGIGFFPAYLEEPSVMLFIVFVIGLRWHETKQTSK
ncbi:hypothetical protein IFO70_09920 [Phormidium tenue FACHB-886]|nr:hypothetical protein [Phormidium tenue FACHB-886]